MFCATFVIMSRSLHVRLDDSSAAAVRIIRNEGLSDSEAVRTALRETAARRRTRSSLAAEVQRLTSDQADRDEMKAIREQMAELAPQPLD
jgi:Arc/MetJ-type ribon-helix-helix transcriptional regulator